jgi:hypothetical protein
MATCSKTLVHSRTVEVIGNLISLIFQASTQCRPGEVLIKDQVLNTFLAIFLILVTETHVVEKDCSILFLAFDILGLVKFLTITSFI